MKVKTKIKITTLSITSLLLMSIFIKEVDASNLINFDFSKITKIQTNIEKAPTDSAGVIDANLKAALNQEINKRDGTTRPDSQDITIQEMESFTNLNLRNKGISNISGFENAVNLEILEVGNNNIENLDPLKDLLNLKTLKVQTNDIKTIPNFKSSMRSIDMSYNNIKDVSPLKNQVKLERLLISDNKISNIKPILSMKNIDFLDLSYNNIKDISGIETLENLEDLYLYNNKIEDASPIGMNPSHVKTHAKDQEINIYIENDILENEGSFLYNVKDINGDQISVPLYLMSPGVYEGDFKGNDPQQYSGHIKVQGTTNIDIIDTNLKKALNDILGKDESDDITDVELGNLTGTLDLSGKDITDITGLQYATNINELILSNNSIKNLEILNNSNLINLNKIVINNNELTKVPNFNEIPNLNILDLSNNIIEDISSLTTMKNLTEVYLNKNCISDLRILEGLSLTTIIVNNQTIEKEFGIEGNENSPTFIAYDVDGTEYNVDMGNPVQGVYNYLGSWSNNSFKTIEEFSGIVTYVNYKYDTEAPDLKFDDNVSTPAQKSLSDEELKSLFNVSAIDFVEGDLTSDVIVDQSAVKYDVPGNYKVTFSVTDPTGNSISKDANLEVKILYPTISADDIYTNVDSISGVDIDDFLLNNANISVVETTKKINDVEVKSTNLSNDSKAGIYDVTFEVSNDFLQSANIDIKVYVANGSDIIDDTNPYIFANDISVNIGSNIDNNLYGAVAFDKDDGDLSSAIKYPNVDTSTIGKKSAKLTVSDKLGNNSEVSINVNVIDSDVPVINSLDRLDIKAKNPLSDDELKSLFKVSANDNYDGDITSDVVVNQSKVNYDIPGVYDVVFSVVDSSGNRADNKVLLKILSNEVPVLKGVEDIEVINGSDFDPMYGVSANDKEDGNITSDIEVYSKDLKDGLSSIYNYSVADSDGNVVEVNRTVKYVSVPNNKPVIDGVNNIDIFIGEDFDPMDGVSASDIEDGDLSSSITLSGFINNKVVGDYTLTYSVVDSDNNIVSVDRVISVYDDINKVNNKIDSNNKNNINKDNKTTIVKKLIETGKSTIYFLFVSVLSFLAYFIQIKKQNILK